MEKDILERFERIKSQSAGKTQSESKQSTAWTSSRLLMGKRSIYNLNESFVGVANLNRYTSVEHIAHVVIRKYIREIRGTNHDSAWLPDELWDYAVERAKSARLFVEHRSYCNVNKLKVLVLPFGTYCFESSKEETFHYIISRVYDDNEWKQRFPKARIPNVEDNIMRYAHDYGIFASKVSTNVKELYKWSHLFL